MRFSEYLLNQKVEARHPLATRRSRGPQLYQGNIVYPGMV